MIRKIRVVLVVLSLLVGISGAVYAEEKGVSADDALKQLLEGNKRYAAVKMKYPDQTLARRMEVASGQHPIAVVLSCSDSRVPPELVFDEGIGDIFVVRTAGNVVDDVAIGSIEYAIEHLGAKLIVVMGHEKCGAVKATVDGGEVPGHIGSIVDKIKAAVESAKKGTGDLLDNSVRENVKMVVAQLDDSKPILSEKIDKKEIQVVGARYDLDTGVVEILK